MSFIALAEDQGQTIKVRVTFSDDAGNETTLTSVATEAVEAAPQPDSPATGVPTITRTAQVGETLTVDTSGIADADGLENVLFSYQWVANDGGTDTDISGETDATYTLVADDEGKTIKVKVTFTDDASNQESLASAATDAVAPAPQPDSPATGQPTISGTVQVGETLTADTSAIADDDGLVNATYTYQWVAGESDIGGATGSSYTLEADDEGKTIKVRVTVTDDAGNETTLSSGATDTVEAPQPPAKPTGLSAAAVSHDAVTLAWDNPQDDSITGYVILRRDREIHPVGTFVTITDDTGSADTTYTDDTVEPDKQYVYRIKAINEHGKVSEISDWVRGFTPAVPVPGGLAGELTGGGRDRSRGWRYSGQQKKQAQMYGRVRQAYRTRNRSGRGLGPTGKAMPALALERVAGCAPGGTLAPCLDSVHTTAEESTTSRSGSCGSRRSRTSRGRS